MTLPKENLDNKTFDELVKDAVSRIPVYAPAWTDHNTHDPGITFIELFAWLTEMQLYRLNRINDNSYRKFLKLVGIKNLKPAMAAQVDVTFSPLHNSSVSVPKTHVAAVDPVSGEDILFETEEKITALNSKLVKILSKRNGGFSDNSDNMNKKIPFYAFGYDTKGDCAPKAGNELCLGFDRSPVSPESEVTLVFYIVESDPSKTGGNSNEKPDSILFNWENPDAGRIVQFLNQNFHVNLLENAVKIQYPDTDTITISDTSKSFYLRLNQDKTKVNLNIKDIRTDLIVRDKEVYYTPAAPKLKWEYSTGEGGWISVNDDEIGDGTSNLTASGMIRIRINNPMVNTVNGNNLFWIRCTVEEAGYDIPPKIGSILLNTVHAIQQTAVKEQTFSGSGLPDFYIDLKDVPVLDADFGIQVNTETWNVVEDFDASKPSDKHFIIDTASGRLSFGNGIRGCIPPKGENNIVISYRCGGGSRGNVKPNMIRKVLEEKLALKVSVDNLKPASGGEEAETIEEAIYRSRTDLKTITRAVTTSDYEYLAMNTPDVKVARVKALPGYHPSHKNEVPGIVSLVVLPHSDDSNPKPSADFLEKVYNHIDEYRLLTTELFVLPPVYTGVKVTARVFVKPKSKPEAVEIEVKKKLKDFLDPIIGGMDGNGWPFGRHVYLSEIYQVIDGVEGVDYVTEASLSKTEENGVTDPLDKIEIPAHGLVYLLEDEDHKITVEEEKFNA
jgi:uncharacterized phage protein gp47/JayE